MFLDGFLFFRYSSKHPSASTMCKLTSHQDLWLCDPKCIDYLRINTVHDLTVSQKKNIYHALMRSICNSLILFAILYAILLW